MSAKRNSAGLPMRPGNVLGRHRPYAAMMKEEGSPTAPSFVATTGHEALQTTFRALGITLWC